jgi:hypothetical protein
MKRLVIVLLLLIALPASAAWKFNPHTGKPDYYETSGSPADNTLTPIKLKATGTPDATMVPFWDSSGLFRWASPSGHAAATVLDSPTIDFSLSGQQVTGSVVTTALDCVVASGASGIMTGADKAKLDGIASGAEVNVNADWNAGSGDAQILNKPTIPADISGAKYVTMQAEAGLSAEVVVPTCTGTDKLTGNGTVISCATDETGGGAFPGYSDAEGDPAAIGTAADGTSIYPSRRDHAHAGSHTALSDIGTNTHATIDTFIGSKGAASGLASLSAGSLVVQNPANAQATAAQDKIPIAGVGGTIATGWIPDLSGTYAIAALGVTNGNSHDHAGGDGAQIAYSGLSGLPSLGTAAAKDIPAAGDASATEVVYGTDTRLTNARTPSSHGNEAHSSTFLTANVYNDAEGDPAGIGATADGTSANAARRDHVHAGDHVNLANKGTNTHAQLDTFVSSKAAASGLASLDAGSKVVQDPTNATATPTASKIVIADGGGKVDGWITAATDAAAGKVELATDAETITGTDTARAVTPANARSAYTPANIAATPGSDHTATGPTTNALNAGGTITIMDLVILNSSSQWVQTDANAAATYAGMLAISLESKTSGQAMKVALPGTFVRDDTWAWTPGAVLYLSETAGQITATQPTTTDAAIRVIGFAVTADVIYFFPSPDWITHT